MKLVTIGAWVYPETYRTRQSSACPLMVLGGRPPGRVRNCQLHFFYYLILTIPLIWHKNCNSFGQNGDTLTLSVTSNEDIVRSGEVIVQYGETFASITVSQMGKFPSLIEPNISDGADYSSTIIPKSDSMVVRWHVDPGDYYYIVYICKESTSNCVRNKAYELYSGRLAGTDTTTFDTSNLESGIYYVIILERLYLSGSTWRTETRKSYYFAYASDEAWIKLDGNDPATLSDSYKTFSVDGPDEFTTYEISANSTWMVTVSDPEWMIVDTSKITASDYDEKRNYSDMFMNVLSEEADTLYCAEYLTIMTSGDGALAAYLFAAYGGDYAKNVAKEVIYSSALEMLPQEWKVAIKASSLFNNLVFGTSKTMEAAYELEALTSMCSDARNQLSDVVLFYIPTTFLQKSQRTTLPVFFS